MDVPLPLAISLAMAVQRCNTECIARWSMSWATPEASRYRHWATTCSVLPRQPPENQAKQRRWTTLLAILMEMTMHWYDTMHIAWWKRFEASIEATGRRHWASICSNIINWTCLRRFCVYLSTLWKRAQSKGMTPINNRGMTYQTDEKPLSKMIGCLVGGGGGGLI